MQAHLNTYQGMNKDTAYDSVSSSLYIDALDIRISTDKGESIGAWTNIKGNKNHCTLPLEGTFNGNNWSMVEGAIIGYTTIRNKIIVFIADNSDTNGWIFEIQYDPATKEILPGFPELKYYNPNLNFKKAWPIEALGRYESDCVSRVYWTDYNNFFRSINIASTELETLPLGQVDIYPDVNFRHPLLKIVSGGGQLLSGTYQIAYRLITIDGKQTLVSPPSFMFHIVGDSESLIQSARYTGNPTQVNTGKSVSIELDTSNYLDFDKVEFISIYYENGTAQPAVTSIEEIAINNQTTITLNYTGAEDSIFDLELFTFLNRNYAFKTAKTLTQKDNSLVIGNIKGQTFSVQDLLENGETFDAKTRRYLPDLTTTPFPIDPDPSDPTENNLKNAFNENLNKDAHWDPNWHTNEQYKYRTDGRLGGEGPNISYSFHLEPFTIDTLNVAPPVATMGFNAVPNVPDFTYTHNFDDGNGTYANNTYSNLTSPFLSGLMRGYKRGETYRFGIVFYTTKGEATYVEYIGDIKFPDLSENDSVVNSSGTTYWPITKQDPLNSEHTLGFAMGIKFEIDFSSCPNLLDKISGYQIVRLERTNENKRRLCQGIIKSFWYDVIASPGSGIDFDLKIGGSDRVVHLMPQVDAVSPSFGFPGQYSNVNTLSCLVNHFNPAANSPALFADYYITSQYLGFYSPEISHNYNNVSGIAASLSNNPSLLMVGGNKRSALFAPQPYISDSVDLSSENLAGAAGGLSASPGAFDWRQKVIDNYRVTFNSVENIKKWEGCSYLKMTDDSYYEDKITTAFSTTYETSPYYMRNYWAADGEYYSPGNSAHLNDPRGNIGLPGSNFSEWSKSGTNIIGKIGAITTDPLDPSNTFSLTDPTEDFKIAGNYTYAGGITGLDDSGVVDNEIFPIIDLVTPKKEIYGGYSKSALESNTFIMASPVIDKSNIVANTDEFTVFGGDIFINMFTLQTSTVDLDTQFFDNNPDYGTSFSRTEVVGLESTINIDLAHGCTLQTGVQYTVGALELPILRQENNNTDAGYGKVNTMYAYNSVHSVENKWIGFFVKPEAALDCKINDIRAFLSNVKVNGETVDSWTQFGINNYYDIDDYGPINKLLNWKDTVFFIQDRGVGIYAINRAAITTTADGVPTELGTGQGFGKHQYISKEHGSIHQWAVKSTDTGIYYFDALHRKIFSMTSANSPISEMKGVHSWLQNLPASIFKRKEDGGDNPILKEGVHITKDKINDEVIFTFLSTGNFVNLKINTTYHVGTIVYLPVQYYLVTQEFTSGATSIEAITDLLANSELATGNKNFSNYSLVYDELMQSFSSRYSATPTIWIENNDILLSPSPTNGQALYVHNEGNWGEFYGTPSEASITLVINPYADINKILRTLEFFSTVRDNDKVVDREATITAFEIKNEYQTTGKIPFSSGRIKRRFDKWRIKIPRDNDNNKARLRSTYFIVTLYFDNSDNKELICNRLMSHYDVQMF